MTVCLEQVDDKQLARYAALIYDRTGISISPQKKTLLSNRVRRRLRATGIDGFDAYLEHLRSLSENHAEWNAFLQEITTHETYLFRDEGQWDWFRKIYLPEIREAARDRKRRKTLRIWSAASSTGDEAYTIASCIAGTLTEHADWKIEIVGTDIGVGALEEARAGVYGERAMRYVPQDLQRRFFSKNGATNTWSVKPTLSQWTTFRQHNLLDVLNDQPFDLIFLKNVLIYFDVASKTKVVKQIDTKLRSEGMLITAAAEGVADLLAGMTKIKPWLYQKPSEKQSRTASRKA